MDPATILADVQIVISLARLAIQVGQDAAPFVISAYNIAVKGVALTDDERLAMNAKETELRALLQQPLPDGETDPA